jgi:hypothetical protein
MISLYRLAAYGNANGRRSGRSPQIRRAVTAKEIDRIKLCAEFSNLCHRVPDQFYLFL